MLLTRWLIQCLLVLLSVAFFTLFERKVIGLFHLRLGPNKVGFGGLIQPLLDAFKLLSKQELNPLTANKLAYGVTPLASLFLALFMWLLLPLTFFSFRLNFSILLFFFVGSLIVLFVLFAGWASNSKYSLLGSLRSISQSVSYEAVFSTLVVALVLLGGSFSVQRCGPSSRLLHLILFPLWIVCTLAETHRAPFDFAESESELVSGFNTEYSGAFFAFIFLSEYAVLLFSCALIVHIFGGVATGRTLTLTVRTLLLSFLFIWVRVTFCRFRYDLLIALAWKILLPRALRLSLVILAGQSISL